MPIIGDLGELIKTYTYFKYMYFEFTCPYLIVNNQGEQSNDNFIRAIVKKWLYGMTPHTLRHSCATALLNNGANLLVIKELLGHKTVASTQIYTHMNFDYLKKVYDNAHPKA